MCFKKINKNHLFASTFITIVALSACTAPNFMPTGYVYHDKTFKSANPPESNKFTTLQRETMGTEQAAQFRLATYSLVENLTNRAGLPPKPVYVLQPETMSPFYANMDNDVRESLRHLGYKLSDKPDDAYIITYTALVIEQSQQNGQKTSAPTPVVPTAMDEMNPNITMAIHVHDKVGEGSRILTQEVKDFYIQGADAMSIPFSSYFGVFVPPLSNQNDDIRAKSSMNMTVVTDTDKKKSMNE